MDLYRLISVHPWSCDHPHREGCQVGFNFRANGGCGQCPTRTLCCEGSWSGVSVPSLVIFDLGIMVIFETCPQILCILLCKGGVPSSGCLPLWLASDKLNVTWTLTWGAQALSHEEATCRCSDQWPPWGRCRGPCQQRHPPTDTRACRWSQKPHQKHVKCRSVREGNSLFQVTSLWGGLLCRVKQDGRVAESAYHSYPRTSEIKSSLINCFPLTRSCFHLQI